MPLTRKSKNYDEKHIKLMHCQLEQDIKDLKLILKDIANFYHDIYKKNDWGFDRKL